MSERLDLIVICKNLSKSGYGLSERQLYSILSRLSEDEVIDFMYTIGRAVEKLGLSALDMVDEIKD